MNLFPTPVAIPYFYLSVLLFFALHHFYDTFRFGYRWQSFFWLLYGFVAIFLTYFAKHLSALGSILIWLLVFYHYFFWIFLSFKRFRDDRRKKFARDVFIVHIFFLILFFLQLSVTNSLLATLFSVSAFHHLTLIHIIFSTIKELSPFAQRSLQQPTTRESIQN